MLVTRISNLTRITHTREIPVAPEQLRSWEEGMLVQKAMPDLNDKDREFIMSGITPEEWYDAFGDEEE